MRIRNLEEFQARYPMSRAQLTIVLQGQERKIHQALALFRLAKTVKSNLIGYTSDMVDLENQTMKAFLAHV